LFSVFIFALALATAVFNLFGLLFLLLAYGDVNVVPVVPAGDNNYGLIYKNW